MNVLHLVQHMKIGGLEKMAVTLMQKSRFASSSIIVSLEGNKQDALLGWPDLASFNDKLFCLDKPAQFDFTLVKKLSALIKAHNITVIHSHHIGPMLYASLACLADKGVSHVSTVHDAWYLQNFKQRLITKVLSQLTKIHWIADAQVVATDFYEQTSIETDKTILNGIDCSQFTSVDMHNARMELELPIAPTLIGCSARLEPGKGHHDLIALLPSLEPDIEFVFAGSGSLMESLQAQAAQLGVSERIHFLGNVQNMPVFYSAMNVMCLYSQREGLPLSILESMACGKVTVASDVGGISEVLTPEQGILVKPDDLVGLKLAITNAINMKSGCCIRDYIISIADANKMSAEYDYFYDGLSA